MTETGNFIKSLLDNGESFESVMNIFNSAFQIVKKEREEAALRRARIHEITKAIRYYVTASYGADIYTDEYFEQVAARFADLIDKDVEELRDLKAQGYVKVEDDAWLRAHPEEGPDPQSIIDAFVKNL
jgi:hypothetical protein